MEQRKIILFGKTAFCITLPQSWVKKNKLKKGDTIDMQETLRNSLEIIPSTNKSKTNDTTEIDISEKSIHEIISILLATYLNGYSVIILRGTNTGKVDLVRQYVHRLIAAEIMEVTADKIVINILWDITNINLNSIIERVDSIIKTLFNEAADSLHTENKTKDIMEKGYEVQRQVLLAKRAITYALNDSTTAQKFNLSALELYYHSYIIYFLGKIGEYIVEVSRIIGDAEGSMNADIKDELKKLLAGTQKYFDKVVDSYNKQIRREPITINGYNEFLGEIESFGAKSIQSKMPIIPEYLKMIIDKIKETELVIINMETSPK